MHRAVPLVRRASGVPERILVQVPIKYTLAVDPPGPGAGGGGGGVEVRWTETVVLKGGSGWGTKKAS